MTALLGMRALVAAKAGRYGDAERLIRRGLEAQAALWAPTTRTSPKPRRC